LTVALLLRDSDGPPIKGILASYPVCDSRLDTPSYQSFGAGGYGLTLEQMKFVWDRPSPATREVRAAGPSGRLATAPPAGAVDRSHEEHNAFCVQKATLWRQS
jgi:hypothetical protein